MSLKKYMCIDLIMLCIIGILLEALGTFFVNYMYVGAYPTTIVSLLITLLAIIRWGWKGLIVIPFCAVGSFIGGQFLLIKHDGVGNYSWRELISCVVGLSSLAFNLIPFHKFKTNHLLQNKKWYLPLIIILSFIGYELFRGITYTYIVQGTNKYIIGNAIGYDVTALVITLVMGIGLKQQKIMLNFMEKLETERLQAEEDRKAEAEYLARAGKDESKSEKE